MTVKWFERAINVVIDKIGDSKLLVIFKEPLLQTGISQKQSFNNSLNSVLSFKASSKLLGALINSAISNDVRYRTITHIKWKEIMGIKARNKFDQIIEAGEIIDDLLEMDIEEESVASICMGYAYIKTPF